MNRCIGVLAAWLALGHPALGTAAPAASATADAAAPDPGIRIINDMARGNCGSCHALPGQMGAKGTFGPALEGVGSRLPRSDLRQWVTDPRRLRPDTLMPAFGTVSGLNRPWPNRPILTESEIEQVVDTLQSWR